MIIDNYKWPSGVSNVDLNNELLPEIPTNEPILPVPLVEEMESLKTNDNFCLHYYHPRIQRLNQISQKKMKEIKMKLRLRMFHRLFQHCRPFLSNQVPVSVKMQKSIIGRGVKRHTRAATFSYRQQTGHLNLQYLGLMFLSGKGVIKNVKSSIECLKSRSRWR